MYSPNVSKSVFPTARRLAMYQEMDSEEEDCTSHGGTLPRRDSATSHQSGKVVLRSQSTKSHRRTGSRAEAKRASILSKHTAFSSPMVRKHIFSALSVYMCSCTQCLMIFALLFYWFDRKRTLLQIPSSWIKSMSAAVRWSSCVFTVSPWTRSPLTCVTSLTFSLLSLSATLWLCPHPINPGRR